MRRRLLITQKGILLVAVPLVFEIVLISVLFVQLKHFEKEIAVQQHATAIVGTLNDIRAHVENGARALLLYGHDYKKSHLETYDHLLAECPDLLARLHKLTAADKADALDAQLIEKKTKEALVMLAEGKDNFVNRGKFASVSTFTQLAPAAMAVNSGLEHLAQRYHGADEALRVAEENRTRAIEWWLLIGLVVNVGVAVVVMLFFTRSISGRLYTLTGNTQLLAAGKALNPPLDDQDELSDLDQSFRKMADSLTQAQTELIEARDKAVASEENVRLVIDNMPVGILIIDDADQIQLVNPRMESMFGYSKDELLGQKMSMLIPPQIQGFKDKKTNEVRKPGAVKSDESQAMRRNGDPFYCDITISKFKSKEGKNFLVTIQDVTERHEIERLKREFVSMVSHDLRTPLNAVQGTLELLLEGTYGELIGSGPKRVQVAFESIDRLIGLINDLLDIEKMEAGKMRIDITDTALSAVMTNSIESVRSFAEKANVSLEAPATELRVRGDKDRLIQVVINLLSNAVKFSPAGSVVTLCAEPENDMALVKVIDRGRGIPPEHLDAVFERFKQVKTADGARKKGTGLGLPICRAIIESHQGTIGVTSKEGEGSTFFFRVPLVTKEESQMIKVADKVAE